MFDEKYKFVSTSLCNFLQSPVTSCLVCPNISLSTLFSNTFNLCSSLRVRDQVSHPQKTAVKIIFSYIAIFKLLESRKGLGMFSLHHRVQNGSGAHPASYPMGNMGSFPGGKAAGA
jgi:hypothetical protein